MGFSRSLLGLLVDNEGAKLLEPESIFFWSEHSDRAGLDSWLAAMSVGADLRRFIGRWALKGSEDGYVRSASRVVENCQRLASMHARASAKGGPDHFGEEETLAQLRNCLEAQGVDQIQRLTRATACLPPDPFGSVSAGGLLPTQAADENQMSGSSLPGFPALADNEELEAKANLKMRLDRRHNERGRTTGRKWH